MKRRFSVVMLVVTVLLTGGFQPVQADKMDLLIENLVKKSPDPLGGNEPDYGSGGGGQKRKGRSG